MASMDDLLATMSALPTGAQSQDLKELQAALRNALPTAPGYRPVPPAAKRGPHDAEDPTPPPAPVSSWNDAAAPFNSANNAAANWSSGMSNSPRQVSSKPSAQPVAFTGQRTTGFAPTSNQDARPHHNAVLPSNASPNEATGFAHDAFKPLLDRESKSNWEGFAAR